MTPKQKLLAVQFLKQMSEEYGNHGCNDYELPNTPENIEMMMAAELWNVHGETKAAQPVIVSPDGKRIWTSDFFVIDYLAHLLEVEATQ